MGTPNTYKAISKYVWQGLLSHSNSTPGQGFPQLPLHQIITAIGSTIGV